MSGEIKRMRYVTGLFMNEEEFVTDQEYHLKMRRLHNSKMHTPGIIEGLDLTPDVGGVTIDIQPGMALDRYTEDEFSQPLSREVVVPIKETINIASSGYTGGASFYIWIEYAEEAADASIKADGQPIHMQEGFTAHHHETRPEDEERCIILGKVQLASDGKVAGVLFEENGILLRKQAGILTKEVATDRLTLTDEDIVEDFAYLDGKLFSDGSTGIQLHSTQTEISGNVEIAGKLAVDQNLNVTGKTYASNDVNLSGKLTVAGNTSIDGDVNVTGSNVTINSEELLVKDPIVTINHGEAGDGVTAGDAGFEIERGISQAKARLLFDETTDRFKAGLEGAESDIIRDEDLRYLNIQQVDGSYQPIYIRKDPAHPDMLLWSDTPGGTGRPFA